MKIKIISYLTFILLFTTLIIGIKSILMTPKSTLLQIYNMYLNDHKWGYLYDINIFKDNLFMTNINVLTPGFLTRSIGFGACSHESITDNGSLDLNKCKVLFSRRIGYWKTQQPKYFFYFRDPALFPGFADCLPNSTLIGQERGGTECLDVLLHRLHSNYELVYQNPILWVYDLTVPASQNK